MKRPIVICMYELDELWATDEELEELNDDDIIEIVQEDLAGMLENCEWAVVRFALQKEASNDIPKM